MLYPRIETRVFCSDPAKAPLGKDGKPVVAPFTDDLAKEILGWQDEAGFAVALESQYTKAEIKNLNTSFGEDYLFKDRNGDKIRCGNNLHNRPFYAQTAEDWMLEILRRKWQFNGESMIVDKYGGCQDIQHRAIGLVWACQEWELDRKLPKPQQKWQEFWPEKPTIDCIVVFGIEDSDDVVNTINTGKPRTLSDAIYRTSWLADKPLGERQQLAKVIAGAVTYLWKRTEAKAGSLAPRRPHSESFEFLDNHKRLRDKCVPFIVAEGDGKKLTPYLSLGWASALLYLMGSASSDFGKYTKTGHEKSLDWSLYDKAEEFWTLFCNNAKELEPLREELERLPMEIGAEFKVDMIVKAWTLFSDGQEIAPEAIQLNIGQEEGHYVLAEAKPRLGGIDVEPDEVELVTAENAGEGDTETVDDKAARGICPKLSTEGKEVPHEYVTEDGETYCKHCLDPKP